jgi:hypothetical protein
MPEPAMVRSQHATLCHSARYASARFMRAAVVRALSAATAA